MSFVSLKSIIYSWFAKEPLGVKYGGTGSNSMDVVSKINELESAFQFSTSDIYTGQTWIDGSPIYRRVFEFGEVAAGTSITVATGFTDVSVIRIDCISYDSEGRVVPIPFSSTTNINSFRDILIEADGRLCVRCGSAANIASGYVIVEYI